MIMFAIAATGLLALAMWMLLGRTRTPQGSVQPAADADLDALRTLARQVERDLAAGLLTDAQADEARQSIERRALGNPAAVTSTGAGGRGAPTPMLMLGVPAFALALYAALGTPQGWDPPAAGTPPAQATVAPGQVEAMVDQLAAQLHNPPAGQFPDASAWAMLARAQASLQRFSEAEKAYARAIALAPGPAELPGLLADRADLLSAAYGPEGAAEAAQLVRQALALDPRQLKALALAGTSAFDGRDYAGAARYWQTALAVAPAGSPFTEGLQQSLEAARAATAGTATPAVPTRTPTQATAASPTVSGTLRLAPSLAARVKPDDTVFIFARALDGPRMPLAVVRGRAGTLPMAFVLDDSSALMPGRRLSDMPRVVLVARISRSGDATPQAGELYVESAPVAVGAAGVNLLIDSVQP